MWDGFQSLFADRIATGCTFAVGAFFDAVQSRIDLGNFQKGGAFEPLKDFVRFGFGRSIRKIWVRRFAKVAFYLVDLRTQKVESFY